MQNEKINLGEIKLVGITARTNNNAEMNPETAKISATLGRYYEGKLADKIIGRIKPGVTYCVYTDFETDENGEYTYFVGEEVDSFENVDPNFKTLTIPRQDYIKFNVGPGKMPDICIKAWQDIWKMKSDDFGAERSYIADFEIYDERAADISNASFDIYLGMKG